MRIMETNAGKISCLVFVHDCEEDVEAAQDIYAEALENVEFGDSADMEALGEYLETVEETYVSAYLHCILSGQFRNVTSSVEMLISYILGHAEYLRAAYVTDRFSIMLFNPVNFPWLRRELGEIIRVIYNVSEEGLNVYNAIPEQFAHAFAYFLEECTARLLGKSTEKLPARLKRNKLVALAKGLLTGEDGNAVQELLEYLEPKKFKVNFKTTSDLMQYCNLQDLNRIIACDSESVVQWLDDYDQLTVASDYGEVRMV